MIHPSNLVALEAVFYGTEYEIIESRRLEEDFEVKLSHLISIGLDLEHSSH